MYKLINKILIRKTFLLLLLTNTSCWSACNRSPLSSIPNAPVLLNLNLTIDYNDLNIPYRLLFFEKKEPEKGVLAVGYGGVVVFSYTTTKGVDFVALDTSCPYEKKKDFRVEAFDDTAFLRCPNCGSTFELYHGFGQLQKGPAKEFLKKYKTRVWQDRFGNKILSVTQ